MAVVALCAGCSGTAHGLPGIEPHKVEPRHCYGRADRSTPGIIDGFTCSCPCRGWGDAPHMRLWRQSRHEFEPNTDEQKARYRELMIQAGLLTGPSS